MADTNELGLLQMGVAQVIKPRTGEVLGYVRTTPDADTITPPGVGTQYQQWLLHAETENDFEVRPDPTRAGMSESDWKHLVAEESTRWRPGWRFIWARARIYTYAWTSWTTLPTSEDDLPRPRDPGVKDITFQLDVTGGRSRAVELQQAAARGLAFVRSGKNPSTTHEYWCTGPSFQPAGKSDAVAITPHAAEVTTLDAFLRLAAPLWVPGSSLTIVGCATYAGDVPYAW